MSNGNTWIEIDPNEFEKFAAGQVLQYTDRKVLKVMLLLEDWKPGHVPMTNGEKALSVITQMKSLASKESK